MKTKFVKYTPPENVALQITVQVLPEPDGDYTVLSGYVREIRNGRKAHMEFQGADFSKVMRKLEIDEAEVRLAIEDALAKKEEGVL
jgi:hypothetical protein